jgi:hypothetical protein
MRQAQLKKNAVVCSIPRKRKKKKIAEVIELRKKDEQAAPESPRTPEKT